MDMNLCFATDNQHKLSEIQALLGKSFIIRSLEEIGCREEIPEIHPTIRENSLAKAEYVYSRYRVNCFADDTGLEVDALGGEPGVHSARYAGPGKNSNDNITLLLKNLQGHSDRKARFLTIITLILDGKVEYFEGMAEGTIIKEKRGVNGFGYDPIFIPLGYSRTFAEMLPEEKNRISHRALASGKLVEYLRALNQKGNR